MKRKRKKIEKDEEEEEEWEAMISSIRCYLHSSTQAHPELVSVGGGGGVGEKK